MDGYIPAAEPALQSRRVFLKSLGIVSGALVLGTYAPFAKRAFAAAADGPFAANAFVTIAPDSSVTVMIKHLDMGQGVTTGLTTIVAEELDADWAQMRFAFSPASDKLYGNLLLGGVQATGGSTAVANSWEQLRHAGASARAMLVVAAAQSWDVPASEITVSKGVVAHAKSGKSGHFGDFIAAAAQVPVPDSVTLKDPKAFTLIGTSVSRIDTPEKITGRAVYSIDIRRPGQLTAVVARPPRFGAKVKSFDASAARQAHGVVDVVEIPTGVAVVAKDTWSAISGRKALKVDWDLSTADSVSSTDRMAQFKVLAASPGLSAARRGDPAAALAQAHQVIEAEFEFPYLAHAPMEPLNGVLEPTADGAVWWAGSQFQTSEQRCIAAILGLKTEQVTVNTQFAGGSFGRRATPDTEYAAEAATIVKATGMKAPIHLMRTREDDMTAGYYRPMVYHKLRAGLGADGQVNGWDHVIVSKSILVGTLLGGLVQGGVDPTSVEGAATTPYAIPNFAVSVHNTDEGVPVLWWRSVGNTHTAQVMETMIDELAHAANADPVAFRKVLLRDQPRHLGVLALATEKAGWGSPLAAGQGRGVAVHQSFGTYVSMVADVTVANGKLKVDRIVAAVDCGVAINPDVIAAQVEGSVGFALAPVLRNKITLKDGEVEQTNFDGFEPTRISEMPKVEVYIVPSAEAPTGIGEPGVPCIAPAIGNAVFAATGVRLRSLPFDLDRLAVRPG
jgi:isoquinoline 1-oxidoreductase beta subunit